MAADEVWAPVAVLTRFDAVARARYVARRTRRLPRRRLAPLEVSVAEARQARRDRRISEAELRRQALEPTEIEMAEQRDLASRRRRALTAVLVVAAAVTGAALYRLIGPGFITGGGLGPQDASFGDLARQAAGGWLPQGLGEPGPGDPFDAVIALMTLLCLGDGAMAVKLMLLLAPLGAALGAWFAAGAATRSVWLRASVAVFYLAAPSFWAAVSGGRLGAVVAHAALPWAMLGVARAIGVNRLDVRPAVAAGGDDVHPAAGLARTGSLAAAAFAGLAFAVAAAGSPALAAPGILAVLALFAIAGRGRRARLVWVALPTLALFAPLARQAAGGEGWRALLADPGLALPSEAAPFWLQLLGWPSNPALPAFVPSAWAAPAQALVTGVVVVGAILALGRTGARSRAVRFGWLLALSGAGAVWCLDRLAVTVRGLEPVSAWTGGACGLIVSGWLLAVAAGFGGAAGEPGDRRHGLRAGLAAVGVAALLVGPIAGLALGVWQRQNHSDLRRAASNPMPPIVAAEAAGRMAGYALDVKTAGDGAEATITWDVVRGVGHQTSESWGIAGSRRLSGLPGEVLGTDAAEEAVGRVLAGIAARNPGDAAARLATYGIGFVLVDARDLALAGAMDATPGLTRVREGGEGSVVWQVAPDGIDFGTGGVDAAARLHVVSPDGAAEALGAGPGTDLRVGLEDGPAGRRLILAERADPRWRASLDGAPLAASADSGEWYQVFELPSGSGRLRVWYAWPKALGVAQAAVVAAAMLLALPIRRTANAREDD